jgi:hypothetical protein
MDEASVLEIVVYKDAGREERRELCFDSVSSRTVGRGRG